MLKYLVKSALDVLKDEGPAGVVRETLKYACLYGSPKDLLRYKLMSALYRGGMVVRDVQGSKMALKLSGGGIHADLFMYGYREPEATKTMYAIMRPDWTVFDIGANIGYYALMEARACRSVYAMEPAPDNFRTLGANVRLNGYPNIRTYNVAIGSQTGTVPFALNPKAPNWHRVAVGGERDENTVRVGMMTLDDFWRDQGRPRVDLLRMDVEGYELHILRSGYALLEACHPAMFLEVHRDHLRDYGGSARDLLACLAVFDYSITHSFVMARPGPTGNLRELLKDEAATKLLTEKGMATHLFFAVAAPETAE